MTARSALRGVMFVIAVAGGVGAATLVLGPREVLVEALDETRRLILSVPGLGSVVEEQGGIQALGNVLLFVPLAVGLAGCVARRWLLAAFLAICTAPWAVEYIQGFLPGRVSDSADALRNSIGILIGFAAIVAIRVAAAIPALPRPPSPIPRAGPDPLRWGPHLDTSR